MHQAKLDRRAALIAAGKRPMGQPPVPMERSSRIIRTRRIVQAALEAEQASAVTASSEDALPKTVANITDPESRLMPTRKGFLQGYNAQLAVTSDQLIVAVALGQSSNDIASLVPMMQASIEAANVLHARTGSGEHMIGVVLADAGYCSEANLAAPGPARLVALNKNRSQARAARDEPATGPPPTGATPRQAMDHRLRTVEGSVNRPGESGDSSPGKDGVMSGSSSKRYPVELRERAVRMVAEVQVDHESEWATMRHVAGLLGVGTPETVRKWCRQAEVDTGRRPGVSTDEAVELKRLKRENAELWRANGMADSSGGRFFLVEVVALSGRELTAYASQVVARPTMRASSSGSAGQTNEAEFLAKIIEDLYRDAMSDIFDACRSLGITVYWGSGGSSLRIVTTDRAEPLSVGWTFLEGAQWYSAKHLTLGVDPASLHGTPSVADAVTEYVKNVGDIAGAAKTPGKLNAFTFTPAVVPSAREAIIAAIEKLVQSTSGAKDGS